MFNSIFSHKMHLLFFMYHFCIQVLFYSFIFIHGGFSHIWDGGKGY